MEYNMMKMIWKIDINDIELQKARVGAGSRVKYLLYIHLFQRLFTVLTHIVRQ